MGANRIVSRMPNRMTHSIARLARKIASRIAALLHHRAGGIAVTFALAAPVLIGAAGIGVEIGLWYKMRRQAQTAADAAAVTRALPLLPNPTSTLISPPIADSP